MGPRLHYRTLRLSVSASLLPATTVGPAITGRHTRRSSRSKFLGLKAPVDGFGPSRVRAAEYAGRRRTWGTAMNRILGWAAALLLALAPVAASARGHSGGHFSHSGSHSHSSYRYRSSGTHYPHALEFWFEPLLLVLGPSRHGQGQKRDLAQRARFMRTHPCPSTGKTRGTCPGSTMSWRLSTAAATIRRTCSGRPRRPRRRWPGGSKSTSSDLVSGDVRSSWSVHCPRYCANWHAGRASWSQLPSAGRSSFESPTHNPLSAGPHDDRSSTRAGSMIQRERRQQRSAFPESPIEDLCF